MTRLLQQLKKLIIENKTTEALDFIKSHSIFSESEQLDLVVSFLREKKIDAALQVINDLIEQQVHPETYDNTDITGLQTTYQLLKTQLLVLSNQKAEAEKLISQFRIRYYQELGFLISEILTKRLNLFQQLKDSNPDNEFEYEKTNEQHKKFSKQWEQVPKEARGNIDEETRQKLTFAYRKASKLCHPDLVDESVKEKAAKIFVELYKAYINNDLSTVEQILHQLEQGLLEPEHFVYNNHKALQAKITQLRNDITLLKKEIESLHSSTTYTFITKLENWDKYFIETKEKLTAELEELKKYAASLTVNH